ncbi:MAG TPA: HtaA domain-containing protein [Solirubrobacteraceae bacterium]|nr:HtaA domain-containing protein [Solirubrobacteraceae bacterium]
MKGLADGPTPGGADILLGLRWAIKRSFVAYISHAPGSQEIVFPYNPGPNCGQPSGSLRFGGTVAFSAHAGALLVQVASPHVELNGSGGSLTIADPFDRSGRARRLLANFDVGYERLGPFERWTGTAVRLAPEATALFNEVYPADAEFDPLTVVLPVQRPTSSG